jgi:hypothetical protein
VKRGKKMNFRKKFENYTNEEIWNEYCGFTDLSIDEFMSIQKSLMQEQLSIWKKSAIGKSMINTDIIVFMIFGKNSL